MHDMKLLVLDKDGTLIRPRSGQRFVQHPQDQELLPGVAEAIAQYAVKGWKMAIASNQGGVAAGHKTLKEATVEMAYCLALLPQIEFGFFCPDLKGKECWRIQQQQPEGLKYKTYEATRADTSQVVGLCRKPNPGMIFLAQQAYRFTIEQQLSQTLMVGDRPEDEQAAQAAGVDFLWAENWRRNDVHKVSE
jgi:D-glycero-D-manno-heptose 1,7-bisphosphate phosphatase